MGEVAIQIAKWTFRSAFIIGVLLSVIALVSIISTYIIAGYNTSVLSDIFALVQVWLPFNLNIILIWLTVSATAYIAYKTAILSYVLLNTFIGKN